MKPWDEADVSRETWEASRGRIAELESAITQALRHADRNGMSEWPAFKALRKVMPAEARK